MKSLHNELIPLQYNKTRRNDLWIDIKSSFDRFWLEGKLIFRKQWQFEDYSHNKQSRKVCRWVDFSTVVWYNFCHRLIYCDSEFLQTFLSSEKACEASFCERNLFGSFLFKFVNYISLCKIFYGRKCYRNV